jgi:succinate dehydrogenase / fumarate reductase, cytochrome b subunit
MSNRNRPISPHLQIYKPQLTSMLSITHRLTGMGLAFGSLALVYFLVSLMNGPESYEAAIHFFRSWMGLVLLFGCTLGVSFHILNGIRHLFWDAGFGLDLKSVYVSGWLTIIGTLLLTGLISGIVLCQL